MWTFLGIDPQHASAYRINSLANVRQRIEFYFLCAWGKKNITKQTFCPVTVSCVWGYCNFTRSPLEQTPFQGFFLLGTCAEISYRWRVTTQIWVVLMIGRASREICLNNQKPYPDLGSDASPVWNFCASHFILRWYQLLIRDCLFVFSGCIAVPTLRGSNRKR